jgi:hypothetical protein
MEYLGRHLVSAVVATKVRVGSASPDVFIDIKQYQWVRRVRPLIANKGISMLSWSLRGEPIPQ